MVFRVPLGPLVKISESQLSLEPLQEEKEKLVKRTVDLIELFFNSDPLKYSSDLLRKIKSLQGMEISKENVSNLPNELQKVYTKFSKMGNTGKAGRILLNVYLQLNFPMNKNLNKEQDLINKATIRLNDIKSVADEIPRKLNAVPEKQEPAKKIKPFLDELDSLDGYLGRSSILPNNTAFDESLGKVIRMLKDTALSKEEEDQIREKLAALKYLKGLFFMCFGDLEKFTAFLADFYAHSKTDMKSHAGALADLNKDLIFFREDLPNLLYSGKLIENNQTLFDFAELGSFQKTSEEKELYGTKRGVTFGERYIYKFMEECLAGLPIFGSEEKISYKTLLENSELTIKDFFKNLDDITTLRLNLGISFSSTQDYFQSLNAVLKEFSGGQNELYNILHLHFSGEEFKEGNIGYHIIKGETKKAEELQQNIMNALFSYKDIFRENPDAFSGERQKYELILNNLFTKSSYMEAQHIISALQMSFGMGASAKSDLIKETLTTLDSIDRLHWSLLPSYVANVHSQILSKSGSPETAAKLIRLFRTNLEARAGQPTATNIEYMRGVMRKIKDNLNNIKLGFSRLDIADMLMFENLRMDMLEDMNFAIEHSPLMKSLKEFEQFPEFQFAIWRLGILAGEDYKQASLISERFVKGQFTEKYSASTLRQRAERELSPRYAALKMEPMINVGIDASLLSIAIISAFLSQDRRFQNQLYFRSGAGGIESDSETQGTAGGGELTWEGELGAYLMGGASVEGNISHKKIYHIDEKGELEEVEEDDLPTEILAQIGSEQENLGKGESGVIKAGEYIIVDYTEDQILDTEAMARGMIATSGIEKSSEALVFVRVRNLQISGSDYSDLNEGTGEELKVYYYRPDGTIQEIHFSNPIEEYLRHYMALRLDVTEGNILAAAKTIPTSFSNFGAEAVVVDAKLLFEQNQALGEAFRALPDPEKSSNYKEKLQEYYNNVSAKFDRLFVHDWGTAGGTQFLDDHALAFMYSGYKPVEFEQNTALKKQTRHFSRIQYFWYRNKGEGGKLSAQLGLGPMNSNLGVAGGWVGLEASFPTQIAVFEKMMGYFFAGNAQGEKLTSILRNGERITETIDWFINFYFGGQVSEEQKYILKFAYLRHFLEAAGFESKSANAIAVYTLNKFKANDAPLTIGALYQNTAVFQKLLALERQNEAYIFQRYSREGERAEKEEKGKYERDFDAFIEQAKKERHQLAVYSNWNNQVMGGAGVEFTIKEGFQRGAGQLIAYITDELYMGVSLKSTEIRVQDEQTGATIACVFTFGWDGKLRIDLGITTPVDDLTEQELRNLLGRVMGKIGNTIVSVSGGSIQGIENFGDQGQSEIFVSWKDGAVDHFVAANAAGIKDTKQSENKGRLALGFTGSYGFTKEYESGVYYSASFDLILAGDSKWFKSKKDFTRLLGAQATYSHTRDTMIKGESWGVALGWIPEGQRPEITNVSFDYFSFLNRFLHLYGFWSSTTADQRGR
ncbi:MAG: hypothetical protein WC501_05730 [Candidatus Micrarchaeia archaeon]